MPPARSLWPSASIPQPTTFLYTANYLGSGINGTVSGFELDPTAGTLVNSENSPYNATPSPRPWLQFRMASLKVQAVRSSVGRRMRPASDPDSVATPRNRLLQ
jgi:hypothetical protein